MFKHQKGASYIGIMFLVIFFAFALKIAAAVVPAYLDDRLINTMIQDELTASQKSTTSDTFKRKMGNRFNMNNMAELKFDDIAKVSNNDGLKVVKSYEVRKNLLMNIDLVITFEKSFDQKSVQAGQ